MIQDKMPETSESTDTAFKKCTLCANIWPDRDEFLGDPSVDLVGYQAFFDGDLELGLFLFNHLECETTLAIRAEEFTDLYDGPVFSERLADTDRCAEHCMNRCDLQPCPNECECAYVREVVQIVKSWPKRPPGPTSA
jgi:hypothetical protein